MLAWQQRNKAKRAEKAGVKWWRKRLHFCLLPQISAVLLQFLFFLFFQITSDLSNYFLSHWKNSLQPVYTLTLLFTAFLSKSIYHFNSA